MRLIFRGPLYLRSIVLQHRYQNPNEAPSVLVIQTEAKPHAHSAIVGCISIKILTMLKVR